MQKNGKKQFITIFTRLTKRNLNLKNSIRYCILKMIVYAKKMKIVCTFLRKTK